MVLALQKLQLPSLVKRVVVGDGSSPKGMSVDHPTTVP